MKKIKKIFTKEVIKKYRNNKDLITSELLKTLRSHGNDGKDIAIEILGLDLDDELYSLDAYGNRLSFNGDRRLKKEFSHVKLHAIHIEEIKKCAADIHYYQNNYVKIITPKGFTFPDLRKYQTEFIDIINDDENEAIISLQPRQAGKSVTVGVYLSHLYIFETDINIGIAGAKRSQATEFLHKTKQILSELPLWMQIGTVSWNIQSIHNENNVRILTDATGGNSFRGHSISVAVVDEAAFIKTTQWDAFADAIFPAQSGLAWKKNILISTANGMNHFQKIWQGALKNKNGYKAFNVHWEEVPRYGPDGSLIPPEVFKEKIIEKHALIYWNQNYGNEFIGSSHTLINSKLLIEMDAGEIIDKIDNKLKVYVAPKKEHQYIMTVDAAKDGTDAFAVNITDITTFEFEQVAMAKLQIDYLLMPEFLFEWCTLYNLPYLIIENNEGAGQSIADQMYRSYEYENLHFDKDIRNKKKKYPGFRTTVSTRKQILSTMKLFIENNKYTIHDKSTINELLTFILLNEKYQADDGCHDDCVMALALTFAPFVNNKNFEDMKLVIKALYNQDKYSEDSESLADMLVVGAFNDGTSEFGYDERTDEYALGYDRIETGFTNTDGFSDYNEFG